MSSEIIREYFSKVQEVHATGVATEHSYRPALEWLFDRIETGVTAVNEPKGVSVGRPDFVFQRGVDQLTVGHCEAKDINLGIDPKELKDANKAQFERYTKGLPNLIYTNCLDFHFYKQGECIRKIKIADYLLGLQADESQFEPLWNALRDFTAERLQTITSAEKLAELMAGKAAITKDVLFNTLKEDKDLQSELAGQYEAFKDQLLHDLDIEEFADIYAETIAYGMFGARLHDEVKETFSRTEALEKLPKSNPFLRKLFEFVAGPNLEEGLRRTVDELAEIFQAVDLQKLFKDFGTFTQRNDPFIHFYETFLAKYNPAKRKARGVWYTPEPVVNFIVRAVDDVLKTEFGLSQGLADTSKISVDWDTGTTDKKGKPVTEKKEVHRVQILDPAAGTGTFLAEVIRQIGDRVKDVAPGQWSSYVEKDLIPRLHGFELLMASYAMCHMKLDMMLTSMGYKPSGSPPRLGVYLTNSLEEGERVEQTLPFARWLSEEARGANTVKNDVPVMCVIGNPPYSGESANKGEWIMNLMEAYKKEPGGKQKLQERNPKLINDDYVKFIRLAESMIDKNGEGVLGFITNHGYIDNPTFRGMRWHLLKTFDKIWVLDLHGNAKKKEVAPDGSPDKNVFDIQQGVALIIAVKKKSVEKDKPLAVVLHGDLWGSRQEKYGSLSKLNEKMKFGQFEYRAPYFFFEPFDYTLALAYESGFSISEYFVNLSGVKTGNDADLISLNSTFDKVDSDHIRKIQYRPFDIRFINFDPTLIQRNRISIMRHMMAGENLALNSVRQLSSFDFQHVIAAQDMIDIN
nr:N-6 DNA methylase [Rhizobiaceae bacterium]